MIIIITNSCFAIELCHFENESCLLYTYLLRWEINKESKNQVMNFKYPLELGFDYLIVLDGPGILCPLVCLYIWDWYKLHTLLPSGLLRECRQYLSFRAQSKTKLSKYQHGLLNQIIIWKTYKIDRAFRIIRIKSSINYSWFAFKPQVVSQIPPVNCWDCFFTSLNTLCILFKTSKQSSMFR